MIYNIMNVFTVTSDQFTAPLPNRTGYSIILRKQTNKQKTFLNPKFEQQCKC